MMKFLYFSAPWCGPCRVLGPTMERVKAEGISVEKILVDENEEMSMNYNVRNIPTVVLVDQTGKEFARTVGVQPLNHYIEQYNNFTNV